jgi:hypothetical protein
MSSLNKKITELTELVVVDDTDLLVIVDDVSGTPTTKKITRLNLVANIQPAFKKLVATNQDAGQLNLTDLAWATSKVMITQIKVSVTAGTSTDYEIAIYEKDTFLVADRIFDSQGHSNNDAVNIIIGSLAYVDIDNSNELHFEIIDNDGGGAPKFRIELRGWGLN